MITVPMTREPTPTRSASDARALLHPVFWVALALLLLNDHLFKGSELVPAALAGKLSDFAGLVVAPIALSALLRSRTVRRRALAFSLVAGWFALANLFAPVAEATTAIGAGLGLGWTFWVDPTDLVALVVLPLSWHVAASRPEAPRPARALGERLVLAVAVAACVASPPPPDPTFTTAAWVVNRTDRDIEIRVRMVSVSMDCVDVRDHLREVLPRSSFAAADRYLIPAGETFPLRREMQLDRPVDAGFDSGIFDPGVPLNGVAHSGSCEAAILSADGLDERILFWDAANPQTIPVAVVDAEDEEAVVGGIDLVDLESGTAEEPELGLVAASRFLVESPLDIYDGGAGCVEVGAVRGFHWSTLPRWEREQVRLLSVRETIDECLALELRAPQSRETIDAFLCIPPEDFPFLANSLLEITQTPTELHIVRDLPLEDGTTWRTGELRVVRGGDLREGPFDVALAQTEADCLGIRMECGGFRVPQAASLRTADGMQFVHPGQATERTTPDGRRARLRVGRTESAYATHATCGAGRNILGARLEALVVYGEAPR